MRTYCIGNYTTIHVNAEADGGGGVTKRYLDVKLSKADPHWAPFHVGHIKESLSMESTIYVNPKSECAGP